MAARLTSGSPPTPVDVVAVPEAIADGEQPPVRRLVRQERVDVRTQHLAQVVRQVHDPLRALLRQPDGEGVTVPLLLPRHLKPAQREVDVADLDARCLAFPQPGERAQGHVGPEAVSRRHAPAVSVRH